MRENTGNCLRFTFEAVNTDKSDREYPRVYKFKDLDVRLRTEGRS